ncbi:Receptor-like cytosolic serine/threonine-protein kinase rbk2 [Trifolium repens]|nr:Receptor-like cytosolic serine/threonine-protein kinase rbk2 [Trifolium repens]
MANDDDHHHKDYCIWNPKTSPANKLKKISMEDAFFNHKHKSASVQDCISDFDADRKSELVTGCSSLTAKFQWEKAFKIWKKKSINHISSLSSFCVPISNSTMSKSLSFRENPTLSDLYSFRSSLVNFTLSDLRIATNNFSKENLIGRGGFAEVYKGCLQDGQLIAVKWLNKGTSDERTSNFLSELGIIAHLNHPNTAKLIGCGVEGEMHLVFQLSPLGSLDTLLHGSHKNELDWSKRYKIIVGIADGLLYLHENCRRRIIHRDIKAGNILLTENFEPQICDFGLAKWLPEQCSHHNVQKSEGTFGYFAPEYLLRGIVDEKTDVYSFGVLLLEIITGRRALDHLHQSLVLWTKPLLDANNIKDLVDPSLGGDYDQQQMDRIVLTASLCVENSPILRPRMSQVSILLRGDECAKEYQKQSPQRTYSEK